MRKYKPGCNFANPYFYAATIRQPVCGPIQFPLVSPGRPLGHATTPPPGRPPAARPASDVARSSCRIASSSTPVSPPARLPSRPSSFCRPRPSSCSPSTILCGSSPSLRRAAISSRACRRHASRSVDQLRANQFRLIRFIGAIRFFFFL